MTDGGAPVTGAAVLALDTLGDRRASSVTDSTGAFELLLTEGGRYRVRVATATLEWTTPSPLELAVDEEVTVAIRLDRRGAGDAVEVLDRQRPGSRHLREYYDRLERYGESGRGIFITREDLESMGVRRVGQAVELRTHRRFRARGGGGLCRPAAYWNGMEMRERWDPYQSEAADLPVDEIEGIEIYYADRMEVPTRYLGERCGLVLIWTRPRATTEDPRSTLAKLLLFVGAGVLFFVLVGS